MGIQVTKTESGWQITKDGNTFSVVDKNKNGRWDGDELAKSLSGSGYLSAEESYEAKYQIAQMGDGVSAKEMAQYETYQKAKQNKEEKEEQIAQYQLQTQKQAQPKKKSVWQKIALGSMVAMPVFSSLSALFGSWSYNNGNYNDTALRITGAATNTMFSLSAMMPMLMSMNNSNVFGSTAVYNTTNANINFDRILQQQDTYISNLATTYANALGSSEKEKEKESIASEQKKAENRSLVEKAYIAATNQSGDKLFIDDSNKSYILDLYLDKEEYTNDEMKNIEKIRTAASIPFRHISDSSTDKTKLPSNYANTLHNILKRYEEANEAQKPDIMSEANYQAVLSVIKKETLTEADVEKLKGITKKPV